MFALSVFFCFYSIFWQRTYILFNIFVSQFKNKDYVGKYREE